MKSKCNHFTAHPTQGIMGMQCFECREILPEDMFAAISFKYLLDNKTLPVAAILEKLYEEGLIDFISMEEIHG